MFSIIFKIFMQLLKITFHLQLLQNIGYIPYVVQYILGLSYIQQFVSPMPWSQSLFPHR